MIQLLLLENNPFERLSEGSIGDFVGNFCNRLDEEPYAITQAVSMMEKSESHYARAHAENWAQLSDVVAEVAGIQLAPITKPVSNVVSMDAYRSRRPEPVSDQTVSGTVTDITEAQARARVAQSFQNLAS